MSVPRILLVDLNNFSQYPTLSVGYLVSILRQGGMEVNVLSPLSHGIGGVEREPRATAITDLGQRLNYAFEQAPGKLASQIRNFIRGTRKRNWERRYPSLVEIVKQAHITEYDAVLVSAYLMYYPVCVEIGRMCEKAGVPLLIGGSYFAEKEVAHSWIGIPGLCALVGGEIELELCELVLDMVNGRDLARHRGIWLPDGRGSARLPLKDLDCVPFPDFSDFPWSKYPHRIIPMITGRGCGWGVCSFCSDVTSTAGRTFRSRSPNNVMAEVEHQSRKHETSFIVFTDLKLNSDPSMWETVITSLGQYVKKPRWIASVHVDAHNENGLDPGSLRLAKDSGVVRLTTGLESGSQRILDRWSKGTKLATTSRFLSDAATACISVRVTMIHGAPEETAEDVHASAAFLERHKDFIDRVSLNRFQLMIGTTFESRYIDKPARNPSIIMTDRTPTMAQADHEMTNAFSRTYFKATQRLLAAVHGINRKPLPNSAREFIGVM